AAHTGDTDNPHAVTASQIGAGTFSTDVILPGSQVNGAVGTATNQSGGSVDATTGSFSGAVTVLEPTQDNHPATKGYVDGYEAFPVGAAYSSVTDENPSTALGYGAWVQLPSPTAPVVLFEGVAVLSIDEEEITWFDDLNDHGGVDAFTHITFGFGRVNSPTSPVSVYTEIHNMVQGVQSNSNTIILYGTDGWDDFRVCNAQLSSSGILFAYAYEDGRNISTPTVRRIIGHKKVCNLWERTG
ncbi:hypothetical protein, partial [Vibrio sp. F13]|uniref:hypothetical protein n=1 Tax=Vibrio sp. F13 TaxID=2070777 RepID=UPI0019D03257